MQKTFSDLLIHWYFNNGRNLPWRESGNPYFIWISEIILQQTRVSQGMSYYHRFIERFPTIQELALAPENEILLLWQGLGYYSRARNLHTAAKYILEHHQGVFPTSYKEIIQLKGIGEYTASAICSFAFKQAYIALDGNAYRVFSRYFAMHLPIDTPQGHKLIKELANSVFDPKQPDHFNQAIMDLGSAICTPKQTKCFECPLQSNCAALLGNCVQDLPVKQGKVKQKERFFTYLAYIVQGKTYLYKRSAGDVWQGLYEFPMIETFDKDSWLASHQKYTDTSAYTCTESESYLHVLSHQRIHAKFLIIRYKENYKPNLSPFSSSHLVAADADLWSSFPISRLMDRFVQYEHFLSFLEADLRG